MRTVSVGGAAYVWEVRGRAAAPLALSHDGDVLDFDVSEDGKRIATGSADGTARVWDAASGELLTKVAPGAPVREVAFRYEGERIRTSTEWGAQQWDARTGAPLEGQGTEGGVSSLDASTWFRRTDDGNAWVKVSDWRRVEFFPRGHSKDAEPPTATLASHVTEVAFGADDTLVAIGTAEGTVHVFEMATGRARGRTMVHADEVRGVAFAPGGGAPRLATASRDGTARLWDADTGRPRGEPLRHPGPVRRASPSCRTGASSRPRATPPTSGTWTVCPFRPPPGCRRSRARPPAGAWRRAAASSRRPRIRSRSSPCSARSSAPPPRPTRGRDSAPGSRRSPRPVRARPLHADARDRPALTRAGRRGSGSRRDRRR